MAEYHVGCNPDNNVIYAGTVNKAMTKWIRQTDVTQECLEAVRNHFFALAEQENTNELGYRWELSDGRVVTLKITIEIPEETNGE